MKGPVTNLVCYGLSPINHYFVIIILVQLALTLSKVLIPFNRIMFFNAFLMDSCPISLKNLKCFFFISCQMKFIMSNIYSNIQKPCSNVPFSFYYYSKIIYVLENVI